MKVIIWLLVIIIAILLFGPGVMLLTGGLVSIGAGSIIFAIAIGAAIVMGIAAIVLLIGAGLSGLSAVDKSKKKYEILERKKIPGTENLYIDQHGQKWKLETGIYKKVDADKPKMIKVQGEEHTYIDDQGQRWVLESGEFKRQF